jgi:hypothetical protein
VNYAVEMGSGAMIYILSFIQIGSGIQKLIGGIHIYTHTYEKEVDLISLFLFFQNTESRLKRIHIYTCSNIWH